MTETIEKHPLLNSLKVKVAWGVLLLGSLGFVLLSVMWAIERMSYGRVHSKAYAIALLAMAFTLLTYCIKFHKGNRARSFKSQTINALEIGPYFFWAMTSLISIIMLVEVFVPGSQLWQDAFEELFIPIFLALVVFSVSTFYIMVKRRIIPVAESEHLPKKWSPRWYIALLITLVLFLYAMTGAVVMFSGRLPMFMKVYAASTLIVGIGFLVYLFTLRRSVKDGKLLNRTPIYLEVFAYAAVALSLFEGLRKLPNALINFSSHYGWTIGHDPDFIGMVRFLMPALCLSLAFITVWLIRVRLRLPRDEYF